MRTGVCVIEDGRLEDRHVHSYLTVWTEKKMYRILKRYKRYLGRYDVTAIIVKIPARHKFTKGLLLLMTKIEELAKEYGCDFDLITKSELMHRTHCHTTAELVALAKRTYPVLADVYEGMDHDYAYKKLFEAVMSAHLYTQWQLARIQRTKE